MGMCAYVLPGYGMVYVSVYVYVRGFNVCLMYWYCECVCVCVWVAGMFTICVVLVCRCMRWLVVCVMYG